ncbi:MAPEG family protein [Maricurvus nonylphenolicus]|uniref:MAPEG family protein n=1 Tax=Maricurvus nonylphenolicus TaxID=1008307 RepID=UPI0036F304E0
MGLENIEAIKVVVFWAALNFGVMLFLAINVYRWRAKEGVAVGVGSAVPGLEKAIRAHGNNIEYVPSILLGLMMLAVLGESVFTLHVAGVTLLLARVLHAVGIQQNTSRLPPARVLGNILCWGLFLLVIVRLLMLAV